MRTRQCCAFYLFTVICLEGVVPAGDSIWKQTARESYVVSITAVLGLLFGALGYHLKGGHLSDRQMMKC